MFNLKDRVVYVGDPGFMPNLTVGEVLGFDQEGRVIVQIGKAITAHIVTQDLKAITEIEQLLYC